MKRTKKGKEGENLKKCELLPLLVVALNLVDIVTTIHGFSLDGIEIRGYSLDASEGNLLFPGKSFIARESLFIKVCLSIVYAGAFIAAYRLCMKESFSKGLWILNITLVVLIGIYAVVVANNLLGIIAVKEFTSSR